VTIDASVFARLSSAERARVERFAHAFVRVDAGRYATLTEGVATAEVEAAQDRAAELLGQSSSRRAAVKAAIRAFTDVATVAYANRVSLPDTLLMYQSLPDRAEDRMRFLVGVERVVVAVILGDELSEDDRELLIGPWRTLLYGGDDA
jgi:hypothetical protein